MAGNTKSSSSQRREAVLRGRAVREIALRYKLNHSAVTAGATVLYERIAEAFEPEWLELFARAYIAAAIRATAREQKDEG